MNKPHRNITMASSVKEIERSGLGVRKKFPEEMTFWLGLEA